MSLGKNGTKLVETEVEVTVDGTDYAATVEVDLFIQDPWIGSPHTCDSSDDYYGYTEIQAMNVLEVFEYGEKGDIELQLENVPEKVIDAILNVASEEDY